MDGNSTTQTAEEKAWELENDGVPSTTEAMEKAVPMEQTEYKPKAHLVLEGSESQEWGVVKDCLGRVNYIPPDAEIVGSWSRYGDGTYWVSLTTSLEALRDRSTRLFAQLAEARLKAEEAAGYKPKPKRARAPKEPRKEEEETPEVSETTSRLDALRKKLKGTK